MDKSTLGDLYYHVGNSSFIMRFLWSTCRPLSRTKRPVSAHCGPICIWTSSQLQYASDSFFLYWVATSSIFFKFFPTMFLRVALESYSRTRGPLESGDRTVSSFGFLVTKDETPSSFLSFLIILERSQFLIRTQREFNSTPKNKVHSAG